MDTRVEFGANGRQMVGWRCTDIDTVDITKPLPFEDGTLEECYTSHTPEHVSCADCMKFFKEVFRVLRPSGKFRIVVPAIGLHMTRQHVQDLCEGHGHLQTFSFESLRAMLYGAGFEVVAIRQTDKKEIDVHAAQIGEEKDAVESLRVEAFKL